MEGFETIIAEMPNPTTLSEDEREEGLFQIKSTLNKVSKVVDQFITEPISDTEFKRTIIAVEDTATMEEEGAEVILAHWGKGSTSPVHGHKDGLLYENLIKGRMLINEYHITDPEKRIVRSTKSYIKEPGEIITLISPMKSARNVRDSYVHNFVALEESLSIHYVAEHTRDGRDNRFSVEHFIPNEANLNPVNTIEAMYSKMGDVILVRSSNVPELGDHYIIVVGHLVMKRYGMRPQEVIIPAGKEATEILDKHKATHSAVLLKLNEEEKEKFFDFHNIVLEEILVK